MEILAGQRWIDRATGKKARVMGVVEGYVIARWPGCMPWLRFHKDWLQQFEPENLAKPGPGWVGGD